MHNSSNFTTPISSLSSYEYYQQFHVMPSAPPAPNLYPEPSQININLVQPFAPPAYDSLYPDNSQIHTKVRLPSAPVITPPNPNDGKPSAPQGESNSLNQNFPQYQPYEHPPVYTPYKPTLTQAVHNQTLKLIEYASKLSSPNQNANLTTQQTIHTQSVHPTVALSAFDPVFVPPINIDMSDRSVKIMNHETHVVNQHHVVNQQESKKEEADKEKADAEIRLLVGIVGTIATAVAAFFLGKAIAQFNDLKDDKSSFETLTTQWDHNKNCYEYDYQSEMDGIVSKSDALLRRKQTKLIHKIALLAFSFIAGGTAIAGALMGSKGLILVSAAMSAGVMVTSLFKLGYSCFSNRDQKDLQAIENSLGAIQQKKVLIKG